MRFFSQEAYCCGKKAINHCLLVDTMDFSDTLQAAKELLGCELVVKSQQGTVSGIIVETEAYLCDDEACHASRGKSKRNATMFEEAGSVYVYLIYGMYHCMNIVTNDEGIGEAVLIRAIEPKQGVELMKQRRGTDDIKNLCSGPGKICQALGVDVSDDGLMLDASRIHIRERSRTPEIVEDTRIGISKAQHLPYRFYIKDSQFVS